jgi:hypothetical protein
MELNQIKELLRRPCDGKGMFFHARLLIVVLIALAAALAGGPRVHAMGADGSLVAMVICSDDGARTIYLDEDGIPASPASDCADCPVCRALSLPALAAPEHALPIRASRPRHEARSLEALVRTGRSSRPRSRAPPTMIRRCTNRAGIPATALRRTTAACGSTKVECLVSGICHGFGRYLEDVRT